MGKSRLVAHFGQEQMQGRAWEGGVWLCDLTEASTVEDLCQALGQTLGVSLSRVGAGQEPTELLGRALAGHGAILVILDNVEHLLQHLPSTLERWLTLAPQARFLATSREVLRLTAERILDLAPLGLPTEGETRLEDIARAEAVCLFVERTQAVRAGYTLTAEDAPLVAEIVQRLDGIALAIELAAARTRLLSMGQIRERLVHRFELLRAGRSDASARQETLQGAIDWSWKLLDDAEQAALAQCSVFRGGFSLEAAEAVLGLPEGSPGVLGVIESLRSKSLLKESAPDGLKEGELRLGMYESIREYALARLAELHGGVGTALVERHGDFYLALGRQLRERVRGAGGSEALRRLALERENLLAACDSALAAPPTPRSVERALGVLVALEPDVTARGPVGIVLSRMERALELATQVSVSPLLRTEVLAARGRLYGACGQMTAARRDLAEARASFQALGERAREKHVLVDLSIIARNAGEMSAAWDFIQEASALRLEGELWLEAYAVGNLGLVEHLRSGAKAAAPHLRAARRLFWMAGDVMFESGFLTNCAMAVGEAGGTQEAIALLREAMVKATSAGDAVGHAIARLNLGCFLLEEDQALEAREHLETTVRLGQHFGMVILEGCARGELGRAHMAMGAMELARSCLSQAVSLLGQAARWHALRFNAHLAAVHAIEGQLSVARASFAEQMAMPEITQDAVLYTLTTLLQAALDLAEARAAPPESPEARQARERARQLVEWARGATPEAMSSDLRGALRFFERTLELG
jgi:predicted ATPase